MIDGRWFVGPHPVRRYRDRIAPGLSYEEARNEILREAERARRVKRLPTGATLYRGRKPHRLRFIVDERARPLPSLVTVLGGWDR